MRGLGHIALLLMQGCGTSRARSIGYKQHSFAEMDMYWMELAYVYKCCHYCLYKSEMCTHEHVSITDIYHWHLAMGTGLKSDIYFSSK